LALAARFAPRASLHAAFHRSALHVAFAFIDHSRFGQFAVFRPSHRNSVMPDHEQRPISGITELRCDVLDKYPATTFVLIREATPTAERL
jgi:hypothetical protein